MEISKPISAKSTGAVGFPRLGIAAKNPPGRSVTRRTAPTKLLAG
jgi:hypothetical protein